MSDSPSPRSGTRRTKAAAGGLGALLLALIVLAINHFTGVDLATESATASDRPSTVAGRHPPQAPARTDDPAIDGERAIAQAFAERTSNLIVEAVGRVTRTLPDDHDGARHQRFILKLAHGQTILIAHNIDLAPRVPFAVGDTIRFKGEYEWSEQGGVIHWTHHDPQDWREGGWIEHDGTRYE